MFESGVSLFPIRCEKPTINKVVNRIPDTTVVLWWKQYPHEPRRFECSQELAVAFPIPTIQTSQDLLGSHLVCRLMESDSHCLCRCLLWVEDDQWICIASPNDTDRDIDDMSFDLATTKRKLAADAQTSLTFHRHLQHFSVDVGTQTVPIEYIY